MLWTVSIYLEAVAILPQLVMLQNSGNVDILTGHYVFFLGCGVARWCAVCVPAALTRALPRSSYRALYLLNWIYRYFHEPGYRHWIGAWQLGVQRCAARALTLARLPCAVWISGTVQTIFYCDFFYYYLKSWKNNERLSLPA